jgi:hypothetical protein
LRIFKGRLTKLAKNDKRVTQEDLKRLFDSQLDSPIWGVIVGALFGGLVTALVTKGLDYLGIFDLFKQPTQQTTAITIVAVGLVFGVLAALYSANEASLWLKARLTRDYIEAREIVVARNR